MLLLKQSARRSPKSTTPPNVSALTGTTRRSSKQKILCVSAGTTRRPSNQKILWVRRCLLFALLVASASGAAEEDAPEYDQHISSKRAKHSSAKLFRARGKYTRWPDDLPVCDAHHQFRPACKACKTRKRCQDLLTKRPESAASTLREMFLRLENTHGVQHDPSSKRASMRATNHRAPDAQALTPMPKSDAESFTSWLYATYNGTEELAPEEYWMGAGTVLADDSVYDHTLTHEERCSRQHYDSSSSDSSGIGKIIAVLERDLEPSKSNKHHQPDASSPDDQRNVASGGKLPDGRLHEIIFSKQLGPDYSIRKPDRKLRRDWACMPTKMDSPEEMYNVSRLTLESHEIPKGLKTILTAGPDPAFHDPTQPSFSNSGQHHAVYRSDN